ncbi:unnamed protein product [Caenorhabditis sp. 36 PRJEB53466]|nr:unnamed protein product [Caenorhabditis sp. 36 PRJEB53466]
MPTNIYYSMTPASPSLAHESLYPTPATATSTTPTIFFYQPPAQSVCHATSSIAPTRYLHGVYATEISMSPRALTHPPTERYIVSVDALYAQPKQFGCGNRSNSKSECTAHRGGGHNPFKWHPSEFKNSTWQWHVE